VSYYRDFDENGVPIDNFWRIDLVFIILFAIDFVVKTLRMSWRQPGMSWWGAMLRRSYDIPLFLPFWRWLRVVPVLVRLHRSKVIDLEDILAAITHEPAAYLADRVSVFLVVRLLNQTQDAVNSGELARTLLAPPDASPEANKIDRILDRSGVNRECIKLEVTESALMEDVDEAIALLEQLKTLGIKLSMDDFGTGYSSLSYLHRFPMDTLKVDQSFIRRMDESRENTDIVKTIIMLGHNFKMDVVAEGIETEQNVQVLRTLNCEYGQGYYFSKPLPVAAVEELLARTHDSPCL